jgi:hypothetical protein
MSGEWRQGGDSTPLICISIYSFHRQTDNKECFYNHYMHTCLLRTTLGIKVSVHEQPGYFGGPEPFGGTITHHHMPPNTVAARVAYLWRGKDKRASLTGVHLIGVHLLGVHLIGVRPRRAS